MIAPPAATRATDFAFSLPDEPGALARFAAQLRAADVNLLGLWGAGGGAEGTARFACVPENAEQFRNFASSAELSCEEGMTFMVGGSDEPGALVRTLEAIGGSGINLVAIRALAAGRNFGCLVWVEPRDWEALTELLGC